MGGAKAPAAPKASKDYEKFIKLGLKYLPQQLQAEYATRQEYDPKFIAEQQGLQQQYGPTQYAQQLEALHTLDPQGAAIRQQLGTAVSGDLASGYSLPQDLNTQLTSEIRGREALTGNELGASAGAAEALYKGRAMQDLYQQHLANAGNFLQAPTPEQQLLAVQPVSAARSLAYVNPNAGMQGVQAGQANYQNMLAQYQAAQGQGAGWGQAIGSLVGTAAGAYYGGYQGAQIGGQTGGMLGGAAGSYFSDARKKNHIEYVGRSPKGYQIFEFNYDEVRGQRFRGTVAQELLATCPEACTLGGDGFWRVDYGKTDIKLEQIPDLVEA